MKGRVVFTMSPQAMEQLRSVAERIAVFNGVELKTVEYLKEHGSMVLRVVIAKEEGIGTQECAAISRALSKKLDELDLIKEHYYLEVSSPGIESING
ncbi:MAG: hypothetical protein RDV48_19730 [Candidatus Eremiobacteraeota bacterium]|nr:hypothetical protein [Candidatus Eremiobacteraeota bacterium]